MRKTEYDHTPWFEAKCKPYIDQIAEFFGEHHLPWYANFAVINQDDKTKYIVLGKNGGDAGTAPRISAQFKISDGYQAVPLNQAVLIREGDAAAMADMPDLSASSDNAEAASKDAAEIKKRLKEPLEELVYYCMIGQIPAYFNGCIDTMHQTYIRRGVPPYAVDVELYDDQIRDNMLIGVGFEAVKSTALITDTPDDLVASEEGITHEDD